MKFSWKIFLVLCAGGVIRGIGVVIVVFIFAWFTGLTFGIEPIETFFRSVIESVETREQIIWSAFWLILIVVLIWAWHHPKVRE